LAAEPWAVIEVADGGIGIAAEDLPYVFERFFRVDAEGEAPGTGLGLPIARELVLLHEGWIDVTSAPGQGSTFTVYLPLCEGA
jgi:signal transduction histidine kinase